MDLITYLLPWATSLVRDYNDTFETWVEYMLTVGQVCKVHRVSATGYIVSRSNAMAAKANRNSVFLS